MLSLPGILKFIVEIMKLKYLVVTIFLALATASCGEYSKLLEGNDYEKQYQEGLRYFKEGKTSRTLALFVGIENIYSGTEKIDTIKFYIASSCYDRGDFASSVDLFNSFREQYSRSPFIERAEYLYAMSFYNQAPNSELDQSFANKARAAFIEFVNRYPENENAEKCHAYIKELEERMHKKDFYVGETYYKISYHQSAITTLRNILKKDAETPLREEILFLILKSQYSYAKESVPDKQKDRFFDVIDTYYSLSSQFPDSKHIKIAKRLFDNATSFTKGTASISELTSDVVRLHDKEYKKKERIENMMLKEDKKGTKKDMNKLIKLKAQLDKIDAELLRLESGKKLTEGETEVNTDSITKIKTKGAKENKIK